MEMKILMAANIVDGKWQFVHWSSDKHNLGKMVNSVQNILNV